MGRKAKFVTELTIRPTQGLDYTFDANGNSVPNFGTVYTIWAEVTPLDKGAFTESTATEEFKYTSYRILTSFDENLYKDVLKPETKVSFVTSEMTDETDEILFGEVFAPVAIPNPGRPEYIRFVLRLEIR